jgi:hypothetical protein
MPTLPQGYLFPNYLTPNDNLKSYEGIVHDMYLKGGYQSVPSLSERNAIPVSPNDGNVPYNGFTNSGDGGWTSGRRKVGMMVYVIENNKFYVLLPVGYFGNGGSGDETAWLALSEAERAVRINPTGLYTTEAPNPGNGFSAQFADANSVGITANANSPWVEVTFEGSPGEKGDKGDAGVNGLDGAVGATGAPGAKGDKGENGAEGLQGPQGEVGPRGNDGAKGDQGDVGPTGPVGQDGADGLQGPIGQTGPAGATGVKGAQGERGLDGAKGAKGDDGQDGATGLQGPKGDKGDQGSQGDIGPAGADGTSVTILGTFDSYR